MKPHPFAARLLAWFDRHRRDLPWRGSSDGWSVWVSEVMLQQTRVEVVREVFPRFLRQFPTPADWARVGDDELLKAWQGLGYYRRARLLRDGARQVVARHGGAVPDDPEDLGRLAGIGEYTRGAVASIAFQRAVPAVDGNVERVLARHAAILDDVKSAAGRRRLRALCEERLPHDRPGDFNQALMDLGATVCTPRSPACGRCPVASDCEARRRGLADRLPKLPPRRAAVDVHACALLIERPAGRILAARIAPGQINEGQVELPGPGVLVDVGAGGEYGDRDARALAARLRERYGATFEVGLPLTTIRHGITHHRIVLTVHTAQIRGRTPRTLEALSPGDPQVPWSTPSRKALARLGLR